MGNKKRIWNFVFFGILIAIIAFPQSRIFIQQQLMKIGFFKPKLEKVAEQSTPEVKENSTVSNAVSFKDEAGRVYNVDELKGKVLFINFWATWCPPCKAEMPSIQVL